MENEVLKKENSRLKRANEQFVKYLEQTNASFKQQLEDKTKLLENFLNKDQIMALSTNKIHEWSKETIVKSLKLRFSLGVSGYNYLHETKFPIPSYSTLNRKLQQYPLQTGIYNHMKDLINLKVQVMDDLDKFCVLSVDEMMISTQQDYDKNLHKYFGHVTLGNNTNTLGSHITVVLARGVKNNWKQVIACEVTDKTTNREHMKTLITNSILFVENCGLTVLSVTSDMGSNNRGLWSLLGVTIKPNGDRENTFHSNNHSIYIIPDVCHLLKNLKSAILRTGLNISKTLQEFKKLPSSIVSGVYIQDLWKAEISAEKPFRLLHHLRNEDLNPSNFDKMNLGAAIRFFSLKTSAGLELAVKLKLILEEALTTAWFIRQVHQWFKLMNSRLRKTSITKRNKMEKHNFFI